MNREDIRVRLDNIVSEQMGVPLSEVTPDVAFVADLGADSLDGVEFVMAVEDEFGIEIPTNDAYHFSTPRVVLDYLVKRLIPHAALVAIADEEQAKATKGQFIVDVQTIFDHPGQLPIDHLESMVADCVNAALKQYMFLTKSADGKDITLRNPFVPTMQVLGVKYKEK